ENVDAVKENVKVRNVHADVDAIVHLYDQRVKLLAELQELQRARNENAQTMKSSLDALARSACVETGRALKDRIAHSERLLVQISDQLLSATQALPNMTHMCTPHGRSDSDNLEIKRCGVPPCFSFSPRDHVELARLLDIVDFEAGKKVSGIKFYYLKREGVLLEQALIMFGLQFLQERGFVPFLTPDIAREGMVCGLGFNPRGSGSNIYRIEGEHRCLVATAEITLGAYHAGEVLEERSLPRLYAGLSHCFRKEAGAAGQFSRGLYRVHQFTKLEMFAYCTPSDSECLHERLRSLEEEIFTALEIPFRVVEVCAGDLGAPAYRKWDLEAWMPGRQGGSWGEVTSASNCTDYQARRLNVRYKDAEGKKHYVHMLNGTALAISRVLIALLENGQDAEGRVRIPQALVPFCGFEYLYPRVL
ncbi:serine--tRNA ligase, partial [Treponema pallidum]